MGLPHKLTVRGDGDGHLTAVELDGLPLVLAAAEFYGEVAPVFQLTLEPTSPKGEHPARGVLVARFAVIVGELDMDDIWVDSFDGVVLPIPGVRATPLADLHETIRRDLEAVAAQP